MFFYLTFIASAFLGGLIAFTQLIGALANSTRAAEVPDIITGLGTDIAVSIFAFLYYRYNISKNAQLAKLSREENIANLKLRMDEKKILPVSAFRGIAHLVIRAGPASFITEPFKLSEPFVEGLMERVVFLVPFATDGNSAVLEFEESEEMKERTSRQKRLWQSSPVFDTERSK